jgi:hypothetical protein
MHAQKDASSVYEVHDGTGGPPSPRTPDELPPLLPVPDDPPDEPPEDVPEAAPDEPPLDVPLEDVPPDDAPPDEPLPDEPLGDSGWVTPAHAHTQVQDSAAATAPRRTPRLFARRLISPLPLIAV